MGEFQPFFRKYKKFKRVFLNKKNLETDYPSRAIEVFRRFHFDLWTKNRNFVFYLTRNCKKAVPISPKES